MAVNAEEKKYIITLVVLITFVLFLLFMFSAFYRNLNDHRYIFFLLGFMMVIIVWWLSYEFDEICENNN